MLTKKEELEKKILEESLKRYLEEKIKENEKRKDTIELNFKEFKRKFKEEKEKKEEERKLRKELEINPKNKKNILNKIKNIGIAMVVINIVIDNPLIKKLTKNENVDKEKNKKLLKSLLTGLNKDEKIVAQDFLNNIDSKIMKLDLKKSGNLKKVFKSLIDFIEKKDKVFLANNNLYKENERKEITRRKRID